MENHTLSLICSLSFLHSMLAAWHFFKTGQGKLLADVEGTVGENYFQR